MDNDEMFSERIAEIKKKIIERNAEFGKRLDAIEKDLDSVGEAIASFSDSIDDPEGVEWNGTHNCVECGLCQSKQSICYRCGGKLEAA